MKRHQLKNIAYNAILVLRTEYSSQIESKGFFILGSAQFREQKAPYGTSSKAIIPIRVCNEMVQK